MRLPGVDLANPDLFVAEVAAELPLQVIAEMIGIPLADRHLIFKWRTT